MGQLDKLLSGKKRSQNRQADVWSVFVQVFTHLIGILCFVAVLSVLKIEEQNKKLEELIEKPDNEVKQENMKLRKDLEEAMLELQRQYLIRAIDIVIDDMRQKINLTNFPNADVLRINNTSIADEQFKIFTTQAMVLYSMDKYTKIDELYIKALKEAKLQAKEVTHENEDYAKNSLLSNKLDGLKNTVQELELNVIHRIYKAYREEALNKPLDESDRLSPGLNEKPNDMIKSIFVKSKEDNLKKILKDAGYEFPPEVWKGINP
jgi:hypothetical protein